ncbi:MAG TPA: hypothetical protein VNQ80_05485 [Parapedobacter sp.]|uniref:hypothetical protein n=1 Tax=Parapedobacter sp. TaxID=1958893 RepID=UPI002C0B33EB|nr:hypothetical protein [Parapedobacter sp.]HWK56763.1 hypothetical protein [Parapedobacter sp.]
MKFILLLSLLWALCACQTQLMRQASQRDSTHVRYATAVAHIEKATKQSIRQHQLRWSAGSTAVVILPKGPVAYHPDRGFEGEATAIVSYGTRSEQTEWRQSHATNQTEGRSSASHNTSVTHTHAQKRASETDRQPATGFSFRWLAIALMTGCVLFVLRRRSGHK